MKEKVLKVLQQKCPEIDFFSSDMLVSDGTLDSLGLNIVIAALMQEFDIDIPYKEIVEANFNSIDAITAMVSRLAQK